MSMSVWFVTMRTMYLSGRATEATLTAAVTRRWITEAEKQRILAEKAET